MRLAELSYLLLHNCAFDLHRPNHFVEECFPEPNSKRSLFITTTTVLPSCPTTPIVSGIRPSNARQTSTTTVPSEITKFCRLPRLARGLHRNAAAKYSNRPLTT